MVRTLHFHSRGPGFDPWSGNEDPACHVVQPKKKKELINKLGLLPFSFLSLSLSFFFASPYSNISNLNYN